MRTKLLLLIAIMLAALNGFSQNLFTLTGVVNDSLTSLPIEGVSVFIAGVAIGTVSTDQGRFMLFLPPGDYEMVFSLPGYQQVKVPISLAEDRFQPIVMKPESTKNSFWNWLVNKKSQGVESITKKTAHKEEMALK
jgi:hypothetical protein